MISVFIPPLRVNITLLGLCFAYWFLKNILSPYER